MGLDTQITKRFDELQKKAEEVSSAREYSFSGDSGKKYYTIPYPAFSGWITNALSLIQHVMTEDSIYFKKLSKLADTFQQYESEFESCKAVFLAAKEDYEGGYLFNVRGLIKAEILSDALDQAKELLAAGYKDPACVLAGVSLELAVTEICSRKGIPRLKLDAMNVELAKAGVYNLAKQKQITAWADLRNKAAHGQWTEYTDADVDYLIQGVERFLADYL